MARLVGEGGLIARAMGDAFESRPEQVRMAQGVARALAARSTFLVEAGTGVGKSFAYLAPAMARACADGEVVVIATNTIALQEQLIRRDVPTLARALRLSGDSGGEPLDGLAPTVAPLKWALVKGRANYLSIRRLRLASQRQGRLFGDGDAIASLHVIEDWAYTTTDGTLSTLPVLSRPEAWDHARSDADNCMGRKCPHYQDCFYQRSRREAEKSNLIICNHAIFLSDLALRSKGLGLLPRFDHVIIDEAHALEENAGEHFGLTLTEGRIAHLMRILYDPRRRTGYLAQLGADRAQGADEAVAATMRVADASREFFDSWQEVIETSGSGQQSLRIQAPGVVANTLTPALKELALRLKSLQDASESDADRHELNSYARRAADLSQTAEALSEQSLPECVYWAELAETAGRAWRPRVELACAPLDVSGILRESLFQAGYGVVLTSATLATGSGFDHAQSRLGCEDATCLRLGSPFAFARQVVVYVDRTMPSPKSAVGSDQQRAYLDALGQRIIAHVSATRGGAFVLFTSLATLRAVARACRPALQELGILVLAQGVDGSRTEILERFKEAGNAVLFGAASFWQGVDVKGDALRCVIITKLPFDAPDRPLIQARWERMEAEGRDPFREDSLPRAVIRFKQGFGRLIRSATDTGRVVVLDPRIATAPYGRAFLSAIPEGVRIISEFGDGDPRTESDHF